MTGCGYYCVIYKINAGLDGLGDLIGYTDTLIEWFEEPPVTFSIENQPDGTSRTLLVLSGPYQYQGSAATNCYTVADLCGVIDSTPDSSGPPFPPISGSGSASVSESISESLSGSISDSLAATCVPISWVTSSTNTNDWTVSLDDDWVDLRVQASGTPSGSASGDCGGVNSLSQNGEATGTFTVPAGKQLLISYELRAIVEAQDAGFDYATLKFNTVTEHQISSSGLGADCTGKEEVIHDSFIFPAGVHTIDVEYDTGDEFFHTDEFGVRFTILSCTLQDVT